VSRVIHVTRPRKRHPPGVHPQVLDGLARFGESGWGSRGVMRPPCFRLIRASGLLASFHITDQHKTDKGIRRDRAEARRSPRGFHHAYRFRGYGRGYHR
jgi:hypothetical protein